MWNNPVIITAALLTCTLLSTASKNSFANNFCLFLTVMGLFRLANEFFFLFVCLFCSPIFIGSPLPESGMKALPPPSGREYGSYYVYSEDMKTEEGRSSRRRRHSSRKSRKVIAAALARLLLEPLSPSDSDEDNEVRAARYASCRCYKGNNKSEKWRFWGR